MSTLPIIDPTALPKHFDSRAAERRWVARWKELGVYAFDPTRRRSETFVVDTPPPTVSGALHVGHVFSYTHPDLIVRYQRMRGQNVLYPLGWDDNGLPTERRVQNAFHVRPVANAPYEPGLEIGPDTGAKAPRSVSRKNFIELCHQLTQKDEAAFRELFERLGLSVDWRATYATIDDRSRRLAQQSFLDLYRAGRMFMSEAPTMWDVDFETAVAHAEIEERTVAGAFHTLEFGVVGSERRFTIATTRPELLPACVGVAAHPDDPRYKDLIGQTALVPLVFAPVPIFASHLVDRDKGTGILMVCTFGDQTDVAWWREHGLESKPIVGRDGRLLPARFGDDGWPSTRPELARRFYGEIAGKNLGAARTRIALLLRDSEASVTGSRPALVGEPLPIQHAVKFYEKGERPLEFVTSRQWFMRLCDRREKLLELGARIEWHPQHMQTRFSDWTRNLAFDWCVSRQRVFGVPIPVWYPISGDGAVCFERPILPEATSLPIDPMIDVPRGFAAEGRGAPGGFLAEADVFDTWFTSSLTPDIAADAAPGGSRPDLVPGDLRPQSHEIIRTWAFYTVAKAEAHHASVPWHHVMVSGWILDPDRKKMSKSRGNAMTPLDLLDEYGVDAVRYWAASASLGVDTAFDPKVFTVGKRLVTKMYNAAKFVLGQAGEHGEITEEIDRAFVGELAALVDASTRAYTAFDYADALRRTESFFWSRFTDLFVELAKPRVFEAGAPGRESAIAALRLGLSVLLRLFAPPLPYVTEEIWSWAFASETGRPSVHRAPWPAAADFHRVGPPERADSLERAGACFSAVNRAKSEVSAASGRVVESIVIRANAATLIADSELIEQATRAARCRSHRRIEDPALADGEYRAGEIVLGLKS
jgi:valyl-tRNA synthetase